MLTNQMWQSIKYIDTYSLEIGLHIMVRCVHSRRLAKCPWGTQVHMASGETNYQVQMSGPHTMKACKCSVMVGNDRIDSVQQWKRIEFVNLFIYWF